MATTFPETGNALDVLRRNAANTAHEWAAPAGGGISAAERPLVISGSTVYHDRRELWVPPRPSVADADDDEFDGVAPAAAWNLLSAGANAIDPYANFAAGNNRHSFNSLRASWWMWQPYSGAYVGCGAWKLFTVGTNVHVSTRVSYDEIGVGRANDEGTVALTLVAAPAGVPDWNNYIHIELKSLGTGSKQLRSFGSIAGVGTSTNAIGVSQQTPIAYLVLHKVGSTVYSLAHLTTGTMQRLGSYNIAGMSNPLAAERIYGNMMATVTPCPVLGWDFIRHLRTATAML